MTRQAEWVQLLPGPRLLHGQASLTGHVLGAEDAAERHDAGGALQLRREAKALDVPVHVLQWAGNAILDGALPADFQRRLNVTEDCHCGRWALPAECHI